jgi:2-C-methyl-D-erythritol 4-phosphate cytidylyltransferase
MEKLKTVAIVTAGGRGLRLPGEVKKQYRMLAGKPLLIRTLEPFLEVREISEILVSLPKEDIEYCRSLVRDYLQPAEEPPAIRYCEGGSQRQDSVFNALKLCPADTQRVLVHDGVRPFISPDTIRALMEICAEYGAAIPGAPVKNTIKTIKEDIVDHTIKRDILIQVYTPQVFDFNILMKCFHRAMLEEYYATDDAALLEHYGYSVHYLTDASHNLKITDEFDFWLADQLLKSTPEFFKDKEK